jgi:UDP-2-acetamido-3-amino-2,3-dideoxy-glucuronate N-acetyltransferase
MPIQNYYAHPTAIIDEGASVGNNTKIWHFSHIMARAIIGEKCNIGQNVFIDNMVQIGTGVKIQNNVSVYNGVIIEDDAFLGPSVVFTNVINPRSFIERKSEFKKTVVEKGSSIGGNATIVCGVRIGSYSLVGAGSVVTRDVPPYAVVVGNPAKFMKWINRAGNTLYFDDNGKHFEASEGAEYYLEAGKVSRKELK